MEKGWEPQVEISPTCPRCGSLNTKFCYYNNYSLTQPRYFCKGCRRYWTKGGSLRNVPVGGGCRKSRRSKPYSDVISIPSRCVPGRPLVALSHSGINIPILSPSTNGSFARIEGSNIDLALVYANFLNQKPRPNEAENYSPHHQIEFPILPNAVSGGPSSCQFSGVEGIHTDLRINQLSYGNGFVDQCRPLSDRSSETHFNINNAFYLSGLGSFEKQAEYQFITSMENHTNNYGLPPLPGEELTNVVSEGLLWSGSNDIIFPSHTLHATQLSGIKEPPHDAAQERINQLGEMEANSMCKSNYAMFSGHE